MNLPASVANKRLTPQLSPLDATITKNRGWGGTAVALLMKNSKCMETPTDSRRLFSVQSTQRASVISRSVLTSSSPIPATCPLGTFLTSLPHFVITSIQRRNRVPLLAPPMQIVHRNVQVDVAARRLDTNDQRFGVRAASQPRFIHVNFRRKHFEMKSLVV